MRQKLAEVAPLLRYPERLPESNGARHLDAFFDAIASSDLASLQSAYSATFDLAPACSPYLGDHVFGDEHRRRARLMAGLRARYGAGGGELPDHIAEVLSFAPHFRDDEWRDLASLVLAPALRKMNAALAESSTPYRHLVAAVANMLEESQP